MMHLSMLSVVEEMPVMEVLVAEGKAQKARARSAKPLPRRVRHLARFVALRVMVTMRIYKHALMELRSRIRYTAPQLVLNAAT